MDIIGPVQHSRRTVMRNAAIGATTLATGLSSGSTLAAPASKSAGGAYQTARTGPVGFTSFIHPTARPNTTSFSIGAASLIEGFVSLQGTSAVLGNASNLQDNDRLRNYTGDNSSSPGDLAIGDGSFTAHNVTFIGYARIGHACGTVISAVVQNAIVHDASLTGFSAHIRGRDPLNPIEIPEGSLVLFGARINQQSEVAANIIPLPAAFALFASDVDQENLLLARAYNLLYRAAARIVPFSSAAGAPGNPGDSFPDVSAAFGQFSLGPPTLDRRGTGVIPARQATLNDLGFGIYQPLSPVPTPATPPPDKGGLDAPPSDSAEAAARFITPRVASPELVSPNAIVLGGVELASGVSVGPESYLHGGDSPAISIGAGTQIGRNVSIHELTFTSVAIGTNTVIADRVVLHGPLLLGNNVAVGAGSVLFGPTVADNVKIGKNVLIFGPVSVTADVPDNSIIVPQGEEGLIAPSHRGPRGSLRQSAEAARPWKLAQACGRGCGCGLTTRLQAFG